ncbi:pyruvate kinase [Vallitalea pronyensis]|uniref:Pyruvate kinase n=1 Tax=Vallitalea pronyensis TaxID=1348613 RepID=A0A8J8MIL9_9FIRM|nr:pyruvate kinase [Vallitalea pronyensis]QUI22517.1 pyruvate kinase [Vallitalea pronyensis]
MYKAKTKIICTIGPASENKQTITELVKNGMSIARLNLSHGNKEYYKKIINIIEEVRQELGIPVAILMDTRGPEIRTKNFVGGEATLKVGQELILSAGDDEGTNEGFCITYPTLYKDVRPGSKVLIDDGLIELEVFRVDAAKKNIYCTVKNGGVVKDKKGINVPNVDIHLPAITDKDCDDILYGLKHDIDFIAASFIRKKEDVLEIRKFIDSNGGKDVKIISKIENQQGVDNIDEIIEVSDAIMIARGDLGVETPTEMIPITQKMIIEHCNKAELPVITATQMLDSMIKNPRPTRAEVSDVANAVIDGTDAIMLSGETAAGAYPIEAVKVMTKIAKASENLPTYEPQLICKQREKSITNAVSYSAYSTAMHLGAKAIICPTFSGNTARMISMYRPRVDIIALTSSEKTRRQMQILWGVTPLFLKKETSTDVLFYKSLMMARELNIVQSKDLVVITAGVPLAEGSRTNLMKVQEVD